MPDAGRELINGRYRLLSVIGQGSMGRVWRARDELLNRDVAVKEILLAAEDEPAELAERAMNEARSTAALSHPGIVTVFDVIEHDGSPMIVMELLKGRSLAEILREEVRLPPRRAAEIGAEMLAALREAHAAGIVHRDLKPANVFVTDRDRVVITDFGIARQSGQRTPGAPGEMSGTPAFVAPEQARNEAAGPPADLWSLGATLFNAVEGRPPYQGPDYASILLTLLTQDPPAPRNAGPLTPVLASLLVRDPERRADADEVAAALDRILRAAPENAPPPPPPAPVTPTAPAAPASPAGAGKAPSPPAGNAGSAVTASTPPPRSAAAPASAAPQPRTRYVTTRPVPPIKQPPTPLRQKRVPRLAPVLVCVLVGFASLAALLNVDTDPSAGSATGSPEPFPSYLITDPPDSTDSPSAAPSAPPHPTGAAFSPDGRTVAIALGDKQIRVYDVRTHRRISTLHLGGDSGEDPVAMALSPDGRELAMSPSYGATAVWNLETHKQIAKTNDFSDASRLTFDSGGGRLMAFGEHGDHLVWRIGKDPRTEQIVPDEGCVISTVSPDGTTLACTGMHGPGVTLWDVSERKQIGAVTPPGTTEPPNNMAFSPDGHSLALDGYPAVTLWNVDRRRQLGTLDTSQAIDRLLFTPDGTHLLAQGEDGLEEWRLSPSLQRSPSELPESDTGSILTTAALSPDGRSVLFGTSSGKIVVRDLAKGKDVEHWHA
ncbi:protein kinase [Actinomadura sp. LD22]|uniref:non-specific serine/threonine protein kinase n=1 Tax=Actinomadura physcomitrii TaxID=2650748 RepID=A0A6I4MGV9_9ACTN|nr:WD40 repeat domain-containing serine/threonine protein kinase [Actinomadura physcomitrii]MWA02961.1 protein kinase [Actinomadura physcomitrii]